MSCFEVTTTTNDHLKFLLDVFWETRGVGEDILPLITLYLKKGTRISDYQFNEPILKFIRSPFLTLYSPRA